jgi:hypothetical protein
MSLRALDQVQCRNFLKVGVCYFTFVPAITPFGKHASNYSGSLTLDCSLWCCLGPKGPIDSITKEAMSTEKKHLHIPYSHRFGSARVLLGRTFKMVALQSLSLSWDQAIRACSGLTPFSPKAAQTLEMSSALSLALDGKLSRVMPHSAKTSLTRLAAKVTSQFLNCHAGVKHLCNKPAPSSSYSAVCRLASAATTSLVAFSMMVSPQDSQDSGGDRLASECCYETI